MAEATRLIAPAAVPSGNARFWLVEGPEDEVVELVLTVARLGDADLRRWWRTQGLSHTGKLVLSRSFPRTWMTATLDLSLRSAGRHHDERLGRSSAVHLLSDRLPYRRWALSWLAERKLAAADAVLHRLEKLEISTAEAAIAARTGPQPSPTGERLGAGLRLGALTTADLHDAQSSWSAGRRLAAAYCGQDAELAIPYFDQT